ncbi:MAG: HEAT repeat domain-containing protein, partial [Planctomycetes bacterium]|nr:HEAT repeat domain-containing protein [Planctomycetota bacterium]
MSNMKPHHPTEGTTTDCTPDSAMAPGKPTAAWDDAVPSVGTDDTALSPNAEAKIPLTQLIATLRGGDFMAIYDASRSLAKLGQEAVPALIEALKDDAANRHAADVLRTIGGEAACAVPGLIQQLTGGRDRDTRCHAAAAIRVLGGVAKDAVPALIATLENAKCKIQIAAAYALGHIGDAAVDAVPALVAALEDLDCDVRRAAVFSLGRIGNAADDAVPALLATARRQDLTLRANAAAALGLVEPTSAEIVATLVKLLHDEDAHVRYAATQSVVEIGKEAKAAIPALIANINDVDGKFSVNAIEALNRFGPDAKDAVPALVEALVDPSAGRAAAELLGNLRADAKDAVPALIKALTIAMEEGCEQEEDDAEMDQPEVEEWDAGFRRLVAEALGKIGPAAKVVPSLVKALGDKYSSVRQYAASALGKIGRPALSAVRRAFKKDNRRVRDSAALALWEMDLPAVEKVPMVLKMLEDVRYG